MNYKELHLQNLKVSPKSNLDFDAGEKSILIAKDSDKIFLHWLTDSGKIRATYSLRMPVEVNGKLRIVNGSNTEVTIQNIKL